MDPLIVDSLIEAGLLMFGGAVMGAGIYYLVLMRLSTPTRRRAKTAAQLDAARAREIERQAAMGPKFPRVLAHLARIVQRAERILSDLDSVAWLDDAQRDRCVTNILHLIRHCQELERVMRARPRRPEP